MRALLPLTQEARPGLVRFADKNYIGYALDDLRFNRRHGSTHNNHDAARLDLIENFQQPRALDAHPRVADKIGATKAIEIDLLDIFVNQRDLVMVGNESGEQREAGHRQIGALAEQRHAMLHPPKRDVEAWIDDDDICHCSFQERFERTACR